MVGARDQFGLPVSTGADVAALWDVVVDDLLNFGCRRRGGRCGRCSRPTPASRSGTRCSAGKRPPAAPTPTSEAELALADQLVAGASERERAFVAGVRATVADPFARPEPWGAYLTSYPSDLLARLDHAFAVRFGFRADHVDVVRGVWEEARQVNGDHPLVLASLGFLAQETGDLDRAESLAQDALDVRSDSVPGAHVLSHVHFERGRHATGLSWLTSWCRDRMPTGSDFAPAPVLARRAARAGPGRPRCRAGAAGRPGRAGRRGGVAAEQRRLLPVAAPARWSGGGRRRPLRRRDR